LLQSKLLAFAAYISSTSASTLRVSHGEDSQNLVSHILGSIQIPDMLHPGHFHCRSERPRSSFLSLPQPGSRVTVLPASAHKSSHSLPITLESFPRAIIAPAMYPFLLMSVPTGWNLGELLQDWREDTLHFLRNDAPKVLFIVIGAIALGRVWRLAIGRVAALHDKRLLSDVRARQIRTLASVISSIGELVIAFVATLMVLDRLGLNLGPLLASAGVAGLAIGFGAQTLVHDFINGFFILLENQYDIGDIIRIAGVKGTVEDMTLRRTVLRDDDGTVHIVPNSQVTIVSNTTRDWSQLTMRVVVAYSEDSDRIIQLLQQVGDELRHDPGFADDIVGDVQVPGIDRVGPGEAEYLMLVKTRPTKQFAVSRELRRRIKSCFEKNNVKTAGPNRVYVQEPSGTKAS